jgi:hypothetical protein
VRLCISRFVSLSFALPLLTVSAYPGCGLGGLAEDGAGQQDEEALRLRVPASCVPTSLDSKDQPTTRGPSCGSIHLVIIRHFPFAGTDLAWLPEQLPQGPPPGAPPLPAIDPNGPSRYTAVQEQLGLKLDAQRGPVEVLVIDKVEQPIPD